jgi:hypothetical protein
MEARLVDIAAPCRRHRSVLTRGEPVDRVVETDELGGVPGRDPIWERNLDQRPLRLHPTSAAVVRSEPAPDSPPSAPSRNRPRKLEILRSLYQGTECWVIDPENKYARLAAATGGACIQLGAAGCTSPQIRYTGLPGRASYAGTLRPVTSWWIRNQRVPVDAPEFGMLVLLRFLLGCWAGGRAAAPGRMRGRGRRLRRCSASYRTGPFFAVTVVTVL